MNVNVAENIIENNWNYNVTAAGGILGYGPRSHFWTQYTNTNGIAYQSIVLMPPQLGENRDAPHMYGDNYYNSDTITFGSTGSLDSYSDMTGLVITANTFDSETPNFAVSTMGFGITYDDNTAYYSNFTGNISAVFTPSYEGMGLPADLYSQYTVLVVNAS